MKAYHALPRGANLPWQTPSFHLLTADLFAWLGRRAFENSTCSGTGVVGLLLRREDLGPDADHADWECSLVPLRVWLEGHRG